MRIQMKPAARVRDFPRDATGVSRLSQTMGKACRRPLSVSTKYCCNGATPKV
ncbi:MAG: hypothetical protein CM15mP120_29220 [Pseudomonadota bacterium]|nr:MAG: hypothetical protein CM15mP120_29220 [Pseudomonadota bacterium]